MHLAYWHDPWGDVLTITSKRIRVCVCVMTMRTVPFGGGMFNILLVRMSLDSHSKRST